MASFPSPPFSIGPYRCVEVLGSGSSGTVYEALGEDNTKVAVKRLHPEVRDEPEIAEALLQALREGRYLGHENVVTTREIVAHEGAYYVVSDYVDGVDLAEVFRHVRFEGLLNPVIAVHIVGQVCQGLAHAHHLVYRGRPAQMLHGALWPSNVLLDWRGRVCLRDFGAWHPGLEQIRHRREGKSRALDGSPEHFTGEELTRATDVFGAGALLYQLLTGHGIFEGKDPKEALAHARGGILGSMDQVPLVFRSLLRRCLAVDPRRRPGEALSLAADLDAARPGAMTSQVRRQLLVFLGKMRRAGQAQLSPGQSGFTPKPVPALAPLEPGGDFEEPTNVVPEELAAALADMMDDSLPGALSFDDADDDPTEVSSDEAFSGADHVSQGPALPLFDDDDMPTAVDADADEDLKTETFGEDIEGGLLGGTSPSEWDRESTQVDEDEDPWSGDAADSGWAEDSVPTDLHGEPSGALAALPEPEGDVRRVLTQVDEVPSSVGPGVFDEVNQPEGPTAVAIPTDAPISQKSQASPSPHALESSWEPSAERTAAEQDAEESDIGVWDSVVQPHVPFSDDDVGSSTTISAPPEMGTPEVIAPERALHEGPAEHEESTVRAGRMSMERAQDTGVSSLESLALQGDATSRLADEVKRHPSREVSSPFDPRVDGSGPILPGDSAEQTLPKSDVSPGRAAFSPFGADDDPDEATVPRSDMGGAAEVLFQPPSGEGGGAAWPRLGDGDVMRFNSVPEDPRPGGLPSPEGAGRDPARASEKPQWDAATAWPSEPGGDAVGGADGGFSSLKGADGNPIVRVPLPGMGSVPVGPVKGTQPLPSITDMPGAASGMPGAALSPGHSEAVGDRLSSAPWSPGEVEAASPVLGGVTGGLAPAPLAPPPGRTVGDPFGGDPFGGDSFGGDPLGAPSLPPPPGDPALSFQGASPSLGSSSGFDEDLYSINSANVASLGPDGPAYVVSRRWTWAHVVLGVAIVIFIAAVALLVSKLVKRSHGHIASSDAALASAGVDGGGTGRHPRSSKDAGVSRRDGRSSSRRPGTKPKPKPKPKRKVVRVVSTPPALLYVNGKAVGKTPQRLPRRRVAIALVKSKRALHWQLVDPRKVSGSTLRVTLKAATYPRYASRRRRGILTVKCDKKDHRRILLRGKDTGFSCSKVSFYLRPGRYRVGFRSLRTGKVETYRTRVRRRRRTILKVSLHRRGRRGRRRHHR
ncbi:MAG: protein kinase [Deltaproteobacteria bacterium]|nr:protein kinase [Deltaproteobacteria bacterium]